MDGRFLILLPIAFAAGIVTAVSPCVFPVLPILFAGGGFKHGQHLLFDRERNYPLPNLFVSMLQRLGLEVDRFATSTGTMRGLEMA